MLEKIKSLRVSVTSVNVKIGKEIMHFTKSLILSMLITLYNTQQDAVEFLKIFFKDRTPEN